MLNSRVRIPGGRGHVNSGLMSELIIAGTTDVFSQAGSDNNSIGRHSKQTDLAPEISKIRVVMDAPKHSAWEQPDGDDRGPPISDTPPV